MRSLFFYFLVMGGLSIFFLTPSMALAATTVDPATGLCLPTITLKTDGSNTALFNQYYDECKRAPTNGQCGCDQNCQLVQCAPVTKSATDPNAIASCSLRATNCIASTTPFSQCCVGADNQCQVATSNACSNTNDEGLATTTIVDLQNAASLALDQTGTNLWGPEQYAGQIIKFFAGIMGALFMINILYAGFLWMTAFGAADKIESAQKTILWSLIGVVIVLASYIIVSQLFSFL